MKLVALLKGSVKGWKADNCLSMGAALAFYSLLSMAPLLVLVISVAGLVIGRDEAQALLMTQLSGLLGDTGAEGVRSVLDAASSDKEGLIQTVVSFVVLLLGATTVFGELQDNLNRIWKCEARASSGVIGEVRKRLLSFGLILVIGLLMLTSLVVSAAISYVGALLVDGGEIAARALEMVGSLVVMTALFAMTFKILPNRHIPWRDVLLGSLVTAVLFSIGKYLIGLYIGKSAVASNFGSAGTLVVVIFWVYYSSQIFFFGAELTREYSTSHGAQPAPGQRIEQGKRPRVGDVNATNEALLARAEEIVSRGAP
ncbi:MAG: YihY/virulence factor BrkB family protein [Usitatibacter sp.]